jgi:UDP-N-acetyl-2-amino-2-deoxyglucuronate dehydrogenase
MSSPREWNVALVGGGNISETHARAATAIAGVRIAAIHGADRTKTERLARQYSAAAYFDFAQLLAHRPLDAVILGSPSGLHAAQGIAAAEHGLHVLTEKPMDISTKMADALISQAERSEVRLGAIFQDRTKPHVRLLKTWLDEGRLGRPLLVDAHLRWYRPPEYYAGSRWRGTLALDGGGALINQGIHTIDLLLWLLGDARCVHAHRARLLHQIEAEDTALAILEFTSGAVATFYATTAAYPGYPRRVEISGTEGSVVLEHDRIVSADFRDRRGESLHLHSPDQNRSSSSASVTDTRGHQAVIEDFLRAIAENRPPMCDGREARRSLALVESIYARARV